MDLGLIGAPACVSPPQAGRPGASASRAGVLPVGDPVAGDTVCAGAAPRSFADTLAAIDGAPATEETSDTAGEQGTERLDITGIFVADAPAPEAQEPVVPIGQFPSAPVVEASTGDSDAPPARTEQDDQRGSGGERTTHGVRTPAAHTHQSQEGFATQNQLSIAAPAVAVQQESKAVVAPDDSMDRTEAPMSAPGTSVDAPSIPDADPGWAALPAHAVAHAAAKPANQSTAEASARAESDAAQSVPAAAQPNVAANVTPRLDEVVARKNAPDPPQEGSAPNPERGSRSGERRVVREVIELSLDVVRARRAFGESLDQPDRQRANQAPGDTENRTAGDRRQADLSAWMQSSAAAAVSVHPAALPLSVMSPAGHSAAAQMFAALTIAPAAYAGAGVSDAGPTPMQASGSLPSDTTAQIVQALRLQRTANGGTAQIRLEPHHFGELSVTIRVEQGQVVARLEAEAPVVREWLQTNQSWLRSSLADQNLTLDRLEIAESGSARHEQRRGENGSQQRREEQPRPRRRRAETGELFEVVA